MADLLMAIGRHGTGPALAIFITAIAAAQWIEDRQDTAR